MIWTNDSFTLDHKTYKPYILDPRRNALCLPTELPTTHPELFYSAGRGSRRILTEYPNIVGVWKSHSSNYNDRLYVKIGGMFDVVIPIFTERGFYGREPRDDDSPIEFTSAYRILTEIRTDYYIHISIIRLIGIKMTALNCMNLPITRSRFPNLTQLGLEDCDLTSVPPVVSALQLYSLWLNDNSDLEEIPYDVWCIPTLRFIEIHRTGIRAIYRPIYCITVQMNINECLYRIGRQISLSINQSHIAGRDSCLVTDASVKVLSAHCSRPVRQVAITILALQKRRLIPNFQRDTATLIVRMILQTQGAAIWYNLFRVK